MESKFGTVFDYAEESYNKYQQLLYLMYISGHIIKKKKKKCFGRKLHILS